MTQVNVELCEDAEDGMFVTLVVALVDPGTGEIEYCNAGHVAPLLLGTDGSLEELAEGKSPAMALARHLKFAVGKAAIPSGAALFFFTDGVTEALNEDRAFFGVEQLHASLCRSATAAADKVTGAVLQSVRGFCGRREQADDITVLCVRWSGVAAESAPASPLRVQSPSQAHFIPTSTLDHGRQKI